MDVTNGLLHVANYVGGSYSAYSVDKTTGAILQEIYHEEYGEGSDVDHDRQEHSHAHMTYFYQKLIYVVDLGADKIWHYMVCIINELL